uniref:Small ribosomal subunit protein mS31 n=1 Tax=Hirondellea gigas TaxID=1518452 RepID=A0A2P2I2U9_9CRUS
MFRFSVSIRSRSESCSLLLRRGFSASGSGSGDGDGDSSDAAPAAQTPQQQKSTEISKEKSDPDRKQELQLKKSAAAKSKLSSLISSLSINKSSSPPPLEVKKKATLELSQPEPRGHKLKSILEDDELSVRSERRTIGKEMTLAVKAVADEVGGGYKTQGELLRSLLEWDKTVPRKSAGTTASPLAGLRGVLSDIEVEKQPQKTERSFPSRQTSRRTMYEDDTRDFQITNLFAAEPLHIFALEPKQEPDQELPVLPTWDALAARELEQSLARPPANFFQEIILWTNQGKVWHFPVDNETDMYEEQNIGFHEHIFLERHISSWCPKTGPIAHFMELVCVGLSKNPHITVERKINVLSWYKQFFDERETLCREVGALPDSKPAATEDHLQTA